MDRRPRCSPLHRRRIGRRKKPSNTHMDTFYTQHSGSSYLFVWWQKLYIGLLFCPLNTLPASWWVRPWRTFQRRRTLDTERGVIRNGHEHQIVSQRAEFTATCIMSTFIYACCLTLRSRLRPKLNLTRNQNIMPANISLTTFLMPPIPA